MNILSLDTTTQTLSAAIMSNDKIIAEFSLFTERTHSERLMPLIDAILTSAEMNIAQIDYFACTVGPGSFTGLRIGISAIKGLAYANGKDIATVSSLDALCENVSRNGIDICPLIDARKSEVFGAFYRRDKGCNVTKKTGEFNLVPDALVSRVKRKTLFLGNGALLYKEALKAKLKEKAEFADGEKNYIRASNVARLAVKKINAGEIIKPEELTPVYLRKSDAELKFRR